jgi:hypothetical protein
MLPIETCLDIILQNLKDNWDLKDRPWLNASAILEQFDVPQGRHEFFKGLMKILIRDGYGELLHPYPGDSLEMQYYSELDHYSQYTILTPSGYYFIIEGGYTQKKIATDAENTRLDAVESYQRAQAGTLNRLTGWIAGGTIALGLIELLKMAIEYHWFPFCL